MINNYSCPLRGFFFLCRSLGFAGILVLFIGGCATELPYLERLRALPGDEHICKVAVLPFTSESDYPQSTAITYKVFLAELNRLGDYLVTQEGDVAKLYQEFRILPGQSPTIEQLQLLVNRLDVQLLFTGHIIEMRENPGLEEGSVNPVLAMRMELLGGGRAGETLWSIYHRRQGVDYQKILHFGKINSMAGLSKQVSHELINLILRKGVARCDVLPQS
jgi:hypothetical protein